MFGLEPRPTRVCYRMNRGGPRGSFILAENRVLAGTAGDNGIAGGILNQPELDFLLG